MPPTVSVHDRVRLRKPHPCGGDTWLVTRIGADIGLQCETCRHRVMLTRGAFNKQWKQTLTTASPRAAEGEDHS